MLTLLRFASSSLFVSGCLVSFSSRFIAFSCLFAQLRSFFALAFCLSPAFVTDYAFIIMLFLFIKAAPFFVFGLCNLVISLFETFIFAFVY